ncbi:MAG: hypothetical protein ACFCGT_18170 [Sandaracinaceae bacterium]
MAAAQDSVQELEADFSTLRLGLDLDFFGFSWFPDRLTTLNLGPAALVDVGGSFLQTRGIGPSFAFALGDRVWVGTRLLFGFVYADPDGAGDFTVGTIGLIPFVEIFLSDGDVVPFVGAQAGISFGIPSVGDATGGIVTGGIFGFHIFLADGFSISPQVQANFLYDINLIPSGGNRAGFSVPLLVAFNGWFEP